MFVGMVKLTNDWQGSRNPWQGQHFFFFKKKNRLFDFFFLLKVFLSLKKILKFLADLEEIDAIYNWKKILTIKR
jgi:hypothetical protein